MENTVKVMENTVTVYEDGGGFLWLNLSSEGDILRDVTFVQDQPGKGLRDMIDAVCDGTDGWSTETISFDEIVAASGDFDGWLVAREGRQIAELVLRQDGTMVLTIEPLDHVGRAGRRYLGLEVS